MVVGGCETRTFAGCAICVGDGTTYSAHDVVVVVAHSALVTGDMTGGLYPANQLRGGQRVQDVVYSLA